MADKQAKLWRVGIQTDKTGKEKAREHLVRATSRQQAIDACTVGMVSAEVAEPDDIYRLAKDGVPITDATNMKPQGTHVSAGDSTDKPVTKK